ncbi:hypothetical protein Tco_0284671, partial [Tanacetum coccineum]
ESSAGRTGKDPDRLKTEARILLLSYVTCSSERQRDIEREWDATDRANRRQATLTEETYLSQNKHDQGRRWKSKSKKQRLMDEDDLS